MNNRFFAGVAVLTLSAGVALYQELLVLACIFAVAAGFILAGAVAGTLLAGRPRQTVVIVLAMATFLLTVAVIQGQALTVGQAQTQFGDSGVVLLAFVASALLGTWVAGFTHWLRGVPRLV